MNEDEIEQYLSGYALTKRYFKGCFARDELRNVSLHQDSLYVINTGIRASEGEHWVLVFWSALSPFPIYFDSFGFPPLYPDISNFIMSAAAFFEYNKQRLQSSDSSLCGHYVVYFAFQLCSGENIEAIRRIHFTNDDFNLNDRIVLSLFKKVFRRLQRKRFTVHHPLTCCSLCENVCK